MSTPLGADARLVIEDYPLDDQDLTILHLHNPPALPIIVAVRPKDAPPGSFTWIARSLAAFHSLPLEIHATHVDP